MPDYTTGILLICLGNLCAATGLTLMKSSTVHEGEKPFFLRWRWLAGFSFLGVLTTVVDVYVLGFLPLSVVAPFAGLTIVFTLAIASTGLLNEPEPLRHTDVIGIGFIIVGEVVVSVFGPHSSHGLTSAEIMADAQKPVFAAFAAASMATVLTWVALGMLPAARERCLRAAAEAGGAASLLATALSAYSAAVCGALGTVFLKIVSEALRANAQGASLAIWATVPMVVATVGLVACAPLSMYLLDTTLASGDVASAVPLYQTSLVLLTSAAGGVFFREFAAMGPPQAIGYTCGIALCLLGLGVLGHAHATEAVEQGERLSTLGEKSPEPPTPLAARLSMADRTAPSRWVATDRRMSVAQIAGSGVVGFGLFAANEMQSPPGLGRQRSMTLPARRVRESDGLLSGDLFGGRSRARTPPPGLVSQGLRRAQTPPPGSVSWKPGV